MSKYPSHLFTTNISLNHFLLMKKFGLYMCRFPTSYPKIPVRQCHGRPELIATILDNAHNSRTNDKMNTIRASQQKQAGTALLFWNVAGGSGLHGRVYLAAAACMADAPRSLNLPIESKCKRLLTRPNCLLQQMICDNYFHLSLLIERSVVIYQWHDWSMESMSGNQKKLQAPPW